MLCAVVWLPHSTTKWVPEQNGALNFEPRLSVNGDTLMAARRGPCGLYFKAFITPQKYLPISFGAYPNHIHHALR